MSHTRLRPALISLYPGPRRLDKGSKRVWWIDFGPLEQRSKPSMVCDSCGHLCSGPLHSQHHSRRHYSNRGWGYKKKKIPSYP